MTNPLTIIDPCSFCGSALATERWSAHSPAYTETVEGGVTVRMVRDTPAWAAEYALQGMAHVTRYTCPQCGRVAAVLARD